MAVTQTVQRLSKRLSGIRKKPAGGNNKDPELLNKYRELTRKSYKEQAIWFLNAFWNNPEAATPKFSANKKDCETVWKYVHKCQEVDERGEAGNELDEVQAHRVLESLERVMTVLEMREMLRKVDVDFNKHVSLLEFMLLKFNADWQVMTRATKENGDGMEKVLAETEALVQSAQKQLEECQALAAEALEAEEKARQNEKRAVAEEDNAKKKEDDAHAKEAVFAKAEEEAQKAEDEQRAEEEKVRKIVAELAAEEKAFQDRMTDLEKQSLRGSIGIVRRGKAKNELFQLKATETIGTKEAKLRQEAALRRQQRATARAAEARAEAQRVREPFMKAREAAVAARKAAEHARREAEEAAKAAELARADADNAVKSSLEAFKKAQASLDEIKKKFADCNQGRFWWMDRELEHAKQFMSKAQLAALGSK